MTVDARMYAVVTHCIWSTPPRSPTMVGSAVAVTVSDSVLTNMASSKPANTAATPRECSGLGSLAGTPPCRADAAASSCARVRAAASRAASDVAEAETWPGACCGRRRIKGRRALGIVDGRGQRGGFGFVAFVHARRVRGRERRPVYAFHACSLSLRDPFQYGRGRADEHAAAAHGNRTVSRASRTRGEARQRPNEAREQRRNAGAE